MSRVDIIYMPLLDEGVDVWKPVDAEHLHDNVYRILKQPHDQTIETWKFEPGDVVICEMVKASDSLILAATRKTGAASGLGDGLKVPSAGTPASSDESGDGK